MANLDRSHLSFMQFYVEDFIRCSPFSTTSLSSVSVFLNFSVDDPARRLPPAHWRGDPFQD